MLCVIAFFSFPFLHLDERPYHNIMAIINPSISKVIHEFDPYFNFRAAQYLYDNGWDKFVRWFDYKVWYPLGRPVGTTIYPGMQVTAVWLTKSWLPVWFGVGERLFGMTVPGNAVARSAREVSMALSSPTGGGSWAMSKVASFMASAGMKWNEMSLNDVCCLLPAWFGALATLVTGMIALECSSDFRYDINDDDNDGVGGGRFGSVLDGLPLVGGYIARYSRVVRSALSLISGMDYSSGSSSPRSSFQTSSLLSMLATMFFMSIVPAHLMRSVGGGYDNESVAMFAMTSVFYAWTRSLRGVPCPPGTDKRDSGFDLPSRTRIAAARGALAGVVYFYMAASWGGYVFVVNLVAAHAASLVLLGRHSSKLHASYTAFYVVGTALATRVPVIGLTPLRSLEQLGPMLVFLGMQLVEYCERVGKRDGLSKGRLWALRFRVIGLAGAVGMVVVMLLWPTGFFGPISSRVRGLFVKHTKTGNPLVDSVAEHQAAQEGSYEQYLQIVAKLVPYGFGMVTVAFCNDASSFLLVYGMAAYYFSLKMVRLILLTAPIASVLGGMLVGRVAGWCIEGVCGWNLDLFNESAWIKGNVGIISLGKKKSKDTSKSDSKHIKDVNPTSAASTSTKPHVLAAKGFHMVFVRAAWIIVSYYLYNESLPKLNEFSEKCAQMAVGMSHPTILFKTRSQDGREILVDDYRQAYLWLGENTPEDARIMAWWDYGYQITAIANRTTIADGNTWNHEHIALLGRALTSPLKEGHRIARHIADYVLLWTGGGGDDMAKSPHLRRIANSVYRTLCPGDPTCSEFSAPGGRPTQSMAESLLFRLHSNGIIPGVNVDKNRFKEVYKSEHGLVRIYKVLSVSQESKEWVLNNRVCDAPGSWFCPGQYPPGLQKVLKEKKDFKQLEDFNAKTEADDEYQRKYFEHLR
jgi:dolichyl-diphosphooligosaccharide--protein glycosyltransferase